MSHALIWLHEEALRATHPVFAAARAGTRAVFVWDDEWYRTQGYSLQRLIFIYETLCELPVDIIRGNVLDVLESLAPKHLYIPASHHPEIQRIIQVVQQRTNVTVVVDEPFVVLKKSGEFKRFFQYWNKAEKAAFVFNGGADA